MAKSTKKTKNDIVYSTNKDFEYEMEETNVETLPKNEQELRVRIEKRNGKPTTVVLQFEGNDEDLKDLGKFLKTKCGVGGSAKNGEILVQGDLKEKVIEILKKEGYSRTK